MATITADMSKCQGYANCVVTAPDFFDLGDDGQVAVLRQTITAADVPLAAEAAASCPVAALRLEAS